MFQSWCRLLKNGTAKKRKSTHDMNAPMCAQCVLRTSCCNAAFVTMIAKHDSLVIGTGLDPGPVSPLLDDAV